MYSNEYAMKDIYYNMRDFPFVEVNVYYGILFTG